MWHEKYRPKNSLKQYFGNQQNVKVTVNYINSVIRENPIGDGLLYYGPPGTGKTSLTQVISETYDLPFIQCNASDERNKDVIQQYMDKGVTKPFGKKVCFLVLDEVEAVNVDLNELIDNTNPILITNDKYKIDKKIRKRLIDLEFNHPSKIEKEKYAKYIAQQEGMNVHSAIIDKVVAESSSFRSVAKNMQLASLGVDDFEEVQSDFGLFEEIEKLCKGEHPGRANINPDDLLKWVFDNGGEPGLISLLDRILGKTPRNDYRSWKYIYDLIQFANANEDIQYPRFFKYLSRYKDYD